jgi:SAM-dependent methyltransferase
MDPVVVFSSIHRVLKPGGFVAINDGRRDLGFCSRMMVAAMRMVMRYDPIASGPMLDGWKSSIAAGYTPPEVEDMLRRSALGRCTVRAGMLHLAIRSH